MNSVKSLKQLYLNKSRLKEDSSCEHKIKTPKRNNPERLNTSNTSAEKRFRSIRNSRSQKTLHLFKPISPISSVNSPLSVGTPKYIPMYKTEK